MTVIYKDYYKYAVLIRVDRNIEIINIEDFTINVVGATFFEDDLRDILTVPLREKYGEFIGRSFHPSLEAAESKKRELEVEGFRIQPKGKGLKAYEQEVLEEELKEIAAIKQDPVWNYGWLPKYAVAILAIGEFKVVELDPYTFGSYLRLVGVWEEVQYAYRWVVGISRVCKFSDVLRAQFNITYGCSIIAVGLFPDKDTVDVFITRTIVEGLYIGTSDTAMDLSKYITTYDRF